ncbi:MAG: acyl-ACP--UDP-N-acetylglucosamine O-acyltransferase [Thermoguttaceae bacterium]|nr:acyl-ACP--UDP-N-acetylglucosamine O-acyltransferase [Thermoguttaceae bacterium]
MRIHPQAVVSPNAVIGRDVHIGPFCVVEDDVVIGDGCILEPRVSIKNGVRLGENNHIYEGTVIGGLPQCVGMNDTCGRVVIGNGNIIRENVTIHRALKEETNDGKANATEIGDNCMFMVNVHVAHDCRIGDNVIIANNTMLAGHVTVGRRAFISGAVGVHQFCHIGAFAMVGGQAHINKDVPPFMTVDGLSSLVVGLNNVGLRRAGFAPKDFRILKDIYRILYESKLAWKDIVEMIRNEYTSSLGQEMATFLSMANRGIIMSRMAPHRMEIPAETLTLKFHVVSDEEEGMTPPFQDKKNVG